MSVDPERTFGYNWVIPNRVGRRRVNVPARDTTKARFVMHGESTPDPDVAQAKACSKCGETKALAEFHRDSSARDGAQRRCKVCRSADAAARYEQHGDAIRATNADYRERTRDERRAYNRIKAAEWRRLNLDLARDRDRQRRAVNVEWMREYNRAYAKRRPDYFRAAANKRRAKLASAAGAHTADQVSARWAMWGDLCWMCGATATCTDHVIPLARGGANWPANLRPACKSCNSKKRSRDWRLFIDGGAP